MNEETKIKILKALKSPVNEGKDVYNILKSYQNDMQNFEKFAKSKNYLTPNVDRWYHPAAMYDATQGNLYRGLMAFGMGMAKEGLDFIKYTKNTHNPVYAGWEGLKDIGRNIKGISLSLLNPDVPVEENELLKNLQTPTMRDIMPEYREKNGKKNF